MALSRSGASSPKVRVTLLPDRATTVVKGEDRVRVHIIGGSGATDLWSGNLTDQAKKPEK